MFDTIVAQYPHLSFKPGNTFMWSPDDQTIVYDPKRIQSKAGLWSLLHELGHSIARHHSFRTDLELIKIEVEAWRHAKDLAKDLKLPIDEDHIQDCLDSYRDWLHARSRCPKCAQVNPQSEALRYKCFNCYTSWTVSGSQLCSVRSVV
jgi:hypothetical protein